MVVKTGRKNRRFLHACATRIRTLQNTRGRHTISSPTLSYYAHMHAWSPGSIPSRSLVCNGMTNLINGCLNINTISVNKMHRLIGFCMKKKYIQSKTLQDICRDYIIITLPNYIYRERSKEIEILSPIYATTNRRLDPDRL